MKDHLVAALAYEGLALFEFGCVAEVFALDRPELGVDWYRFAVCAPGRGPLRASGGVTVQASHTLALLARADTIVVPGWTCADVAPPPALVRRLRAAHERGARIASICSGAFLLAAAGLLRGRAATTHWRYAERLQARFPDVRVQPNALYVDEGSIITSAGSAAGLDMMLHLVRRDHGARIANRVAQRLVIPAHRLGDQAQFVERPLPRDEAARVARLTDHVRGQLARDWTLEALAAQAHMSVRTLQRQFRQSLGLSPVEWLVRERVEFAKQVLETSARPVSEVGALAGFGSDESLRRHFRQATGISPAAWRRQFQTVR